MAIRAVAVTTEFSIGETFAVPEKDLRCNTERINGAGLQFQTLRFRAVARLASAWNSDRTASEIEGK